MADDTIEIFSGERQAGDRNGRIWTITCVSIDKDGYIPDVTVRIRPEMTYKDALFDDDAFIDAVMQLLREAGYQGRAFGRAELGMQGDDQVMLEPNAEFQAFAEEKLGWIDCEKLRPVFEAQADRLLAIVQAAGRTPEELVRFVTSVHGDVFLDGVADVPKAIQAAIVSGFEYTGAATLVEQVSRRMGIEIALENFPADPRGRPCRRPDIEAMADFLLDFAQEKTRMSARDLCIAMNGPRRAMGADLISESTEREAIHSGLADRIEDEGLASVLYDFSRATKIPQMDVRKAAQAEMSRKEGSRPRP